METNGFSSIIAIHGLDTQSPKTWIANKDEGSRVVEVHWLQDPEMLPSKIPDARIFTYDWNSNTFSDAAMEDLFGHADTLLQQLFHERVRLVPLENLSLISNRGP